MISLEADLHAFFERYSRAFHEDVDGFCELYHYPSSTVRLDGTVQWFHTKADAVAFFALAKQKYEDEGCRQWAIRGLAADQLGSGSAVATIDWDMTDADRSPIRGWRQTYNLIRGHDRWTVVHSTLHRGSEVTYPRDA